MIDQIFESTYRGPHLWMHEKRIGHWRIFSFNPPAMSENWDFIYNGFKMPKLINASFGININEIVSVSSLTDTVEGLFQWEMNQNK